MVREEKYKVAEVFPKYLAYRNMQLHVTYPQMCIWFFSISGGKLTQVIYHAVLEPHTVSWDMKQDFYNPPNPQHQSAKRGGGPDVSLATWQENVEELSIPSCNRTWEVTLCCRHKGVVFILKKTVTTSPSLPPLIFSPSPPHQHPKTSWIM